MIIDLNHLKFIDHYDYLSAVSLFEKTNVKFFDALISSISEIMEQRWIVISYDKDFDKLGVKRKEPGEF